MVVIEMNPRVSRSSALASKATGFPIAKIAANWPWLHAGTSCERHHARDPAARAGHRLLRGEVPPLGSRVPRSRRHAHDPDEVGGSRPWHRADVQGSAAEAIRSLEIDAYGLERACTIVRWTERRITRYPRAACGFPSGSASFHIGRRLPSRNERGGDLGPHAYRSCSSPTSSRSSRRRRACAAGYGAFSSLRPPSGGAGHAGSQGAGSRTGGSPSLWHDERTIPRHAKKLGVETTSAGGHLPGEFVPTRPPVFDYERECEATPPNARRS